MSLPEIREPKSGSCPELAAAPHHRNSSRTNAQRGGSAPATLIGTPSRCSWRLRTSLGTQTASGDGCEGKVTCPSRRSTASWAIRIGSTFSRLVDASTDLGDQSDVPRAPINRSLTDTRRQDCEQSALSDGSPSPSAHSQRAGWTERATGADEPIGTTAEQQESGYAPSVCRATRRTLIKHVRSCLPSARP